MSEQKPSLGRVVHFFSGHKLLTWHHAAPMADQRKFPGPFSASVVQVNGDGTVNLHVLFPTRCAGSGTSSETVENVPYEAADSPLPYAHWTWPPRV